MKYLQSTLLLLILAALITVPVSAISIRGLLGLDDEEEKAAESTKTTVEEAATPARTQSSNWARTKGPGEDEVNLELIKRLLMNLGPGKGREVLSDEKAFAQLVQQEARNHSVLTAARQNKLEDDENTVFLMRRGAENILREIYLNRLIAEKLPKDFPSEAQIREYYDKNPQAFVLPEKVHVWQVFFNVSEDMDEKAVTALKQEANGIADRIRSKKISFNDAAVKHSQHLQSSANGGYMGLIKSSDLKPGIKASILELPEGQVSKALTTDTGIHVVKRGAIVPERKIGFEQGKAQIRNLLVTQVQNQLRQAIYEQAAKTYPVEIPGNKIEEWRLRLKTNLDAPN